MEIRTQAVGPRIKRIQPIILKVQPRARIRRLHPIILKVQPRARKLRLITQKSSLIQAKEPMGKTEMTIVTFQLMAKTFRAKVRMTKVRAPLENPEELCVAILVLKSLRRLAAVEGATEMV
jgi:hypothetical protein